jgi:hypothetical protein
MQNGDESDFAWEHQFEFPDDAAIAKPSGRGA